MLKAPKTFSSLFVSLAVHLIGFAILGMIFLKAKPYEEYIEATFLDPLPQKRDIRMREVMIKPTRFAYTSSMARQLPKVTTAVEISGVDTVGFDLGAPVVKDAPLSVATGIKKSHPATVIAASPAVRPKVNISSFKPTAPPASANMNVLSPATVETEMKLLTMPNINVGETKSVDNVLRQYCGGVKRKIEKEKKYPRLAERNGYEGKVEIKFKILADGQVENVEIVNSSGYDVLDNEAVRAIRAAAPYSLIPEALAQTYLWIKVPLVFAITGGVKSNE